MGDCKLRLDPPLLPIPALRRGGLAAKAHRASRSLCCCCSQGAVQGCSQPVAPPTGSSAGGKYARPIRGPPCLGMPGNILGRLSGRESFVQHTFEAPTPYCPASGNTCKDPITLTYERRKQFGGAQDDTRDTVVAVHLFATCERSRRRLPYFAFCSLRDNIAQNRNSEARKFLPGYERTRPPPLRSHGFTPLRRLNHIS